MNSNKRTRTAGDLPFFSCQFCHATFATNKQRHNHKRIHKAMEITSFENLEDEPIQQSNSEHRVISEVAFDPSQPRTYKSSCSFQAGEEGHVYGENVFSANTFTTSQLISIRLDELMTSFNVSTDCHSKIVDLMNTLIRDYDKLKEEYNPKIMHAGPVNNLLKSKTELKAQEYDICKNVCKLYNASEEADTCVHCSSKRYKNSDGAPSLDPMKTMKMMSIGDYISRLLSNDQNREKLHYRHNRQYVSNELSDYFDGEEYKALKEKQLFESPDDIAIALFLDGFVNQKKSKQQQTMVHVMVLNYNPLIRYTDEYLIQLAVIPGVPKDLDSFLLPIIDEVISLGKNGLIINKFNGEKIKAKVHMVMASGDIPQVTKFCHHKGHNSIHGCRVCEVVGVSPPHGRGMYYHDCNASLRPKDDFVKSNMNTGIQKANIFARLPTFNGSSFYGLDEMHLIGHGIGNLVYKLIVLSNTTTTFSNFIPVNSDGSAFLKDRYTFAVSKRAVLSAGECIELSRSTIPVSFQGSWDNIINRIDGTRAIDYIDFLLYVVPTLLVPLFAKSATRKALLALVKGCAISLQWNLNEELIVEMENHFDTWHQFLQSEVNKNNLSVRVFSPVNHYLTHIGLMIRKMGNLRVYSTRSMERTIGRYSRLIKSRVLSGKNAGNLVERLAIRGYLNCAINTEDLLNSIKPKRTSLDDFIELASLSPHNNDHQLWSPFDEIPYVQQFTTIPIFINELKTYYTRSNSQMVDLQNTLDTVKIAARALIGSHVYSSEMYRRKRSEYRRGNHYIRFHAIYRGQVRWFVGSVIFFFTHNISPHDDNCKQFLVLVSVMKDHTSAEYDSAIPVVTLESSSIYQRLVVISLNDVQNQVGLVQTMECTSKYKVVAPYQIFNEDMRRTAGKLNFIKL